MDRAPHFERSAGWMQAAYLARVVDINDPESRDRVQVRLYAFDDVDGQDAPLWARVVCPFAGADRGAFFMPDVDDEVLVVFVQGDPRHPLVVGGLWNGANAAPASLSGGTNQYKCIRSKNGVVVTLDDQQGQEKLVLETPAGQKLTLSDGPGKVRIEDSNGNSVVLESSGITITAAAQVKVDAANVKVTAGMVTVDAAMAKFSGVVKCEVLMATSVVGTSYTPGAGNVW
ncbi:phage baseplate assembly protein V [Thauera sp. 2A1]|uniref:phage baseplate assembly protein V n=1 Tax=Thauera sp. 2A1 TaxID=2570191 RepID=UPI0012925EC7|nr:phage baseplate assembly protein V [Thauera sp. 2A1]KAI5912932.1 phage baseplate assembly protein V [Thauera sp. 2A1]